MNRNEAMKFYILLVDNIGTLWQVFCSDTFEGGWDMFPWGQLPGVGMWISNGRIGQASYQSRPHY